MTKVNSLLSQRLKTATEKLTKMTSLATRSTSGNLSSFSGVFRVSPLTEAESDRLEAILEHFSFGETENLLDDLNTLSGITSEVKAINNQAAILHGERIKQAQELLKKYKEGAFSAWLLATYGNRQTPYNFLQYFELHRALPLPLHAKLDEMPRQAVYTLASRSGSLPEKQKIIEDYNGETKQEILSKIRRNFPLAKEDKRSQDAVEQLISSLRRAERLCHDPNFKPNDAQKKRLLHALNTLKKFIP